jgi:putative SOS response-associated peptidase YedK
MVRAAPLDFGVMCGRFTQQARSSELAAIFDADDLADDPGGRFNVAPTDPAVVVVQRDERRALVRYRWGLVPGWAAGPRTASRTAARAFNARAETITTSPLFRDAFRRRRCLVPVDGFYEWQGAGRERHPLRIHEARGDILALAGLWTGRRDEDSGEWHRTFTIVTTRPNAFMTAIHDRMPVVVPPGAWSRWLDRAADPGELRALLEPRDDIALDAYPVPPLVNNVRNDGPALIERLAPTAVRPVR